MHLTETSEKVQCGWRQ